MDPDSIGKLAGKKHGLKVIHLPPPFKYSHEQDTKKRDPMANGCFIVYDFPVSP